MGRGATGGAARRDQVCHWMFDRPVGDHQRGERARDRHGDDGRIGAPRDRDRRDGEAA